MRYTVVISGMVENATAAGRTIRAKIVQSSQVFSQAQFRINFMGSVKLAFIPPASTRSANPDAEWFIKELLLPPLVLSLLFPLELPRSVIESLATARLHPIP
jgi:hypothetical protein